jgi:hypothetical protein
MLGTEQQVNSPQVIHASARACRILGFTVSRWFVDATHLHVDAWCDVILVVHVEGWRESNSSTRRHGCRNAATQEKKDVSRASSRCKGAQDSTKQMPL